MARSLRFNESDLKQAQAAANHSKPVAAVGEGSAFQALLAQGRKIKEKGMNDTEHAFSLLLEKAKLAGEIRSWEFEPVSLKIAPSTRYNPDFLAVLPDGHWQLIEIKGFLRDDAAVKFKSAAQKFPELSFMMIRKKKGEWEIIYNLPSPNRAEPGLDPFGKNRKTEA